MRDASIRWPPMRDTPMRWHLRGRRRGPGTGAELASSCWERVELASSCWERGRAHFLYLALSVVIGTSNSPREQEHGDLVMPLRKLLYSD
jgi:hypothetical protein